MVAAVTTAATSAFAVSTTFDGTFFHPATGRNTYLMLEGTQTLYPFQFQVGEVFSYGYRPIEIRNTTTNARIQGVIDQALAAHFVGAIGLFDFLEFGVNAPVFLLNSFQSPATIPGPGTSNQFSMGDVTAQFKVRILDPRRFPVGIAVIPFGTAPTGKTATFTGDDTFGGGAKVVLEGYPLRRWGLTLNAGYQGGSHVLFRNVDYTHRFLAGVGSNVWVTRDLVVFAEGNGTTALDNFFKDRDVTPIEAMGGVLYDIGETGVTIRAGGGTCFVCGLGGARVRGVLAATYRYNPEKYAKRDRELEALVFAKKASLTPEQYYTLRENCPSDPAQYQSGVNDESCPKYYELSELSDLYFRCPPPEDYQAGVHDDACQKVFVLGESYTPDEVMSIVTLSAAEMGQRCPPNPDEFNPQIHDLGCPKYYDLSSAVSLASLCPASMDQYQPGIDDPACPKYFELRGAYQEDQWALIARLAKQDSDLDGINDFKDHCPNEPEDLNDFADADGCPDGGVSTYTGGEIYTLKPVYFDFNSTRLSKNAKVAIDQVIEAINREKWIHRVRIGGHADERGTRDANMLISEARAHAVIQYMKANGVREDAELVPIAYGSLRPVVKGRTPKQLAKNRRVVFTVVTDVR
ncbi:MAG: OmpA family protein [Deltaproteobacteria bacterium]|nr:OmpA family protein [Deltaproteobacteria bacterium]